MSWLWQAGACNSDLWRKLLKYAGQDDMRVALAPSKYA